MSVQNKHSTTSITPSHLPEERQRFVQEPLIRAIVGVSKKRLPLVGNRTHVDGVAVVLGGDEAAVGGHVGARLVMPAVSIAAGKRGAWCQVCDSQTHQTANVKNTRAANSS